ncbi:MAG: hypothetical protein Fur0010_23900 [Bdellovibrio sp.]
MKHFDFVIIGEGIAGLYAAFLLSKSFPQKKIALVSDSSAFPPCSYRTTAVVSNSGISLGVSDLGDLLFHAHAAFVEHVESVRPEGIYHGTRYHLSTDGCQAFIKRWPDYERKKLSLLKSEMFVSQEPCYLIDPHEYLSFLKKFSNTEFIQDIVFEVDEHVVRGNKTLLKGEKILIMNGAFQLKNPIKFNLKPQDEFYLKGNRIVPGKFALFQLMNLGEESFVLSHGRNNLIYRSWSQEVLIGGTTNKNESMEDAGELDEMIQFYRNLCSFELPMPVHVDTGLRMKGMKREPRWLSINDYTFALWGSYKNGWSLPHYFLKQFVIREKESG